jgi:hypothetical protein
MNEVLHSFVYETHELAMNEDATFRYYINALALANTLFLVQLMTTMNLLILWSIRFLILI